MLVNLIVTKLNKIIRALIILDQKLGFKKILKYTILVISLISILNIRAVITNFLEIIIDISSEIHSEKLEKRDKYMTELSPLLSEFREKFNADRILYFEYHNSESNLNGVPFKFFDLVKCNTKYGISEVLGSSYKDIGAGMYPELFNDLNEGSVIICSGFYDKSFRSKYPGVFELFNNTDNSNQQVFIGIPGIKKPLGFIVLQWKDDSSIRSINIEKVYENLPRISALSASINFN